LIGPPSAAPKVLRSSRGRSSPERLKKKSLAVKIVLRCDQKAAPWNSFVPDLVTS
jgi:hypothetical protein